MPARNDDVVDYAGLSAVIVDRSIDGPNDASVVIVILLACSVDAIIVVELSDAFSADTAPVDDSGNRGKEG